MSLGVALIGSGIFAREEHLPAIQNTPQLVLRAVHSRSLKSAQGLAEGIHDVELYSDDSGAGRSFDDLLGRSDIQCVIVALPINVQPNIIKSALQHGKHVLSEKPIAPDLAMAEELVKWYRGNENGGDQAKATWSVAENYRFHKSLLYARDVIKTLGRPLGFHITKFGYVKHGQPYFETSWRKTPSYQGGFLLDGGVHFTAALRLLLGDDDPIVRVSAQTTQLQEHLPPSDTVDAVLKTRSNVTGTFRMSFGTTLRGSDMAVACEKGSVTISNMKVMVRGAEGEEDVEKNRDFSDAGFGVKEEVQAWADAILQGAPDARQTPEEAMKDLEILEKMLRSGAADGEPQTISS